MTKIIEDKFNRANYLDWSKMVHVYLRSIDKNDHLTCDKLGYEKMLDFILL